MPEETEPSEAAEIDFDSRFKEMVFACAEFQVNAGLMSSVMSQMPQHVQENWDERLVQYRQYFEAQTTEMQAFGEAFDD